MIGWLKDQKAYGRLLETEADQLVRDHGDAAYDTARAAMRRARDDGDAGLEKFFAKVAVAIAERTDRKIGEDTATRYLTDNCN
jgi:hypothetical protein